MRLRWVQLAACMILSLNAASRGADDPVPDEAQVRKMVDALIENAPNHRATLGTLQGTMALSISFGAPAWNAQDHAACSRFYVKTGESLCAAFGEPDKATVEARKLLDDLKSALDRVKQSNDVDANAWTMRFVFDKTELAALTEAERAARLVALGQQSAAQLRFADAANAYGAATASVRELDGQPIDQIPPACRYAPLALSEALFGEKRYTDAAAAVEEGLRFVPEWPTATIDISTHFPNGAYKLLLDDLQDAASKNPEDASLQLLIGYHLFFTGQHEAARPALEKAAKLNPQSLAAKKLLQACDPAHKKSGRRTTHLET